MSEFEYTYESYCLKCPYCGAENDHEGVDDIYDDKIEIDCECGKKFWGQKHVTINYEGSADCELNNEKHDLKPTQNKGQSICQTCGQYHHERDTKGGLEE